MTSGYPLQELQCPNDHSRQPHNLPSTGTLAHTQPDRNADMLDQSSRQPQAPRFDESSVPISQRFLPSASTAVPANSSQSSSPRNTSTESRHQSPHRWRNQDLASADNLSVSPPQASSSQNTMSLPPVPRAEADDKPWKHRGYPSFSKWMASDDDFFVLRRFESVSARVILYLQDRIAQLEESLHEQDQNCRQAEDNVADSGTFRNDQWKKRGELLSSLASNIERYQKFVIDHSTLKARPKASAFQINNVSQWLENANHPIESREVAYLQQHEDLIPLVPEEGPPLRRFLDRSNILTRIPCLRNRKANKARYDPDDFEMETTVYNRDHLVDKSVTCLTTLVGLGMLIGPLWWLQNLSAHEANLQVRLGVITAFLVLFAILISILVKAKPFEVLAATAAYGAVLMVYMQLGHDHSLHA